VSHALRTALSSIAVLLTASVAWAAGPSGIVEVDDFDEVLRRVAMTAPIPADDVELHGRLATVWKAGEHVIFHLQGDVALAFGQKRMTAARAACWVRTYRKDRRTLHDLLLYAEGGVKLTNGGGSVAENGNLILTLTGGGDVLLVADRKIEASGAADPFVRRATEARTRFLARPRVAEQPTPAPVPAPVPAPIPTPPGVPRPVPTPTPEAPPTTAPAGARPLMVSGDEFKSTVDGGVRVTTIVGSARVRQRSDGEDANDYLEIAANSAVLWSAAGEAAPAAGATMRFEGAYLEGDVRIRQGGLYIRSPRVYFDVAADRFLILDGVLKTRGREGMLPFYLRANEIHRVSKSKFIAHDAVMTSDPFDPPHYHLSSRRLELSEVDIVQPERGLRGARMRFQANDVTFQVRQMPVGWLAIARGEITTDPQPLKTILLGYDDDFGPTISTKWFLGRLLGIEFPEGHRAELRLDYLGSRGPAIGADTWYETDTYYGHAHAYVLSDADPERDERDEGLRGRFLARHKHQLPHDWSLTLELSYLSDRNFLREFDEQEDKEGKAQETLIYGKKQRDNWAMTVQLQGRILDFLDTVERLPEIGFRWLGVPLTEDLVLYSTTRFGWLRYKADQQRRRDLNERLIELDARIAEARAAGADAVTMAGLEASRANTAALLEGDLQDTNFIARFDTRQEVQWPFKLGIWRFSPWASVRLTYQQDGPTLTRALGVPTTGTETDEEPQMPTFETVKTGGARVFGTVGMKVRTDLQRVYNSVTNKLLDLHRLRHVISPEFTAFAAWSTKEYDELFGFDPDVDDNLDAFGAVDLRLKQRWQTMRGGPGKWQSVDFFTLTVGATLYWDDDLDPAYVRGRFFDSQPEFSQARDNLYADAIWRLSETTSILGDIQFDLVDSEVSFANIGIAVTRNPRLSYYFGARYVRAFDATVLTYTLDYRLNYKYRVRLLLQWDTASEKFLETQVRVTRRMPGWIMEIGFTYDQLEQDTSVQFALFPVGTTGMRIGSFE
jgi:hypothetical protein